MAITAIHISLVGQLRSPGFDDPSGSWKLGLPTGVATRKKACSSRIDPPADSCGCQPLTIGGTKLYESGVEAGLKCGYTNGATSPRSSYSAKTRAAVRRSPTSSVFIAALMCWSTDPG